MDEPMKTAAEIQSLKTHVARMQEQLCVAKLMTFPREVRLAMTIEDPDATPTYPLPDTKPNKYAIAFCDGEFAPSQGYELPTISNNSIDGSPQVYALHIHNKYIPVGTLAIVKLVPGLGETDSGEWWIEGVSQALFIGKADALIATDNSGLVSWYTGTQGSETDTTINFTCFNKFTAVPLGAWVLFFQTDDGYYLLPRGGGGTVYVDGTNVIRFRLTQDLPLGSNAMAYILEPDGAGGYTEEDSIYVYDWYHGGTPGNFSGKIGYEGFAVLRSEGAYDIIWMETPAKWIHFTLDEDIHISGGEWLAAATIDYYSHGRLVSEFVEVYAVNDTFALAIEGARGLGLYNDQLDRYELIRCEQMAVDAYATLKHKMCTAAAPESEEQPNAPAWEIENFIVFGEGENTMAPTIAPTSAVNPFNHRGKEGAQLILRHAMPGEAGSGVAGEWTIVDVEKVEITTVVSVGAEGCTLSRATATVVVELCNDPGAAEPYGNTGAPFSFINYKTSCIGGVITTQYQVVDIDPCADPQDTYGDWMTFSAGGCCTCEGGGCCTLTGEETASGTVTSDCVAINGVVFTLTSSDAGATWTGSFTGGCGTTDVLLYCDGGSWYASLANGYEAATTFSASCDPMSGTATFTVFAPPCTECVSISIAFTIT